MNPNCVRKPEQIKLIMECRQSGLSDYQWCREQGIHPGTFYNWVSKLRKASYAIPDSKSKFSALPASQEVVRLDLTAHEVPAPAMAGQNADSKALFAVPVLLQKWNAEISGYVSLMGPILPWLGIRFNASEVRYMLCDISGSANIYIVTSYTDYPRSIIIREVCRN